jgi:hypothetical protein
MSHAAEEPRAPCRLYVYLAREAPIAVVLRRGPSEWARLSLWRTDTDGFEHGQWIRSRVYERRSDVSADGSLFVCFARRAGGPVTAHHPSTNRDTWIAISRPPWFTALALWCVGETYCTGAYFPAGRTLWLPFDAKSPDAGEVPDWLSVEGGPPPHVDRTDNWTERTVHHNRLRRDGWRRVEEERLETWSHADPTGATTLLMTELSDRDFGAYGGPHVVDYAIQIEASNELIPVGRATWADWDHQGRLVVARDGRLVQWEPPGYLHPIADFDRQKPVPEPAPDWASTWPKRSE